jgi:hypothetical protein
MTQRNGAAEDMFEKARAAFFGTVEISADQRDESTEPLNSKRKLTPEVVGPHSQASTK